MNSKIDLGIVIGAQFPDRPHDVVHVSLLRRGRHHGEAGVRGLEAAQERRVSPSFSINSLFMGLEIFWLRTSIYLKMKTRSYVSNWKTWKEK